MKCLVLFFCILVSIQGFEAQAETREFTTKKGTVVRGYIMDYKVENDIVRIKSDEGKVLQVKASIFEDKDFMYIRDWDAVRWFKQNTHFRIYLNDPEIRNEWTKFRWRRRPGKLQARQIMSIDHKRMAYTIKFDNQTGYDLENVELKYCIFYEQERMDWFTERKITDLIVRPSAHLFTMLPNNAGKKFSSNSVVLRKKEVPPAVRGGTSLKYMEGEAPFRKSKILGMMFRASLTTTSGLTAHREVFVPSELPEQCEWVEPTTENMVWPDDDLTEDEDTVRPMTPFEEDGGDDEEGEEEDS